MNKMKTITLVVGLPASGKSTFLSAIQQSEFRNQLPMFFADDDNFPHEIFGLDTFIEPYAEEQGIPYADAYKVKQKECKTMFWNRLDDVLTNGPETNNIFLDRTFLSIGQRENVKEFVDARLGSGNYNFNVVVFDINEELHKQFTETRRLDRNKEVPYYVVDTMRRIFTYPEYREGFDNIFIYQPLVSPKEMRARMWRLNEEEISEEVHDVKW